MIRSPQWARGSSPGAEGDGSCQAPHEVLYASVVGSDLDAALVKRALAGDDTARRSLSRRLLGAIQREVSFCLVRFAAVDRRDPRQDVLDLVQDVLVSLFERDAKELRRWDPERGRSLESFVRLVARRRVARTLSQRQGNPWADAPTDPADLDEADTRALTKRLETRQHLDQLLGALHARMNARDHELFDLLFVQGLEPDDVATKMDMSRGAVNAWSYRTRKLARTIAAHLAKAPEALSSQDAPSPKESVTHG